LSKIEERTLAEEMELLKVRVNVERNTGAIEKPQQNGATTRREVIAQRLLSLLNENDGLRNEIGDYSEYLPLDYLVVFKGMGVGAGAAIDIGNERANDLSNIISLGSGVELLFDGDDEEKQQKTKKEFCDLACQLKLEYLKEKRQGVANMIKEAEAEGNEDRIKKLLEEFTQISQAMVV